MYQNQANQTLSDFDKDTGGPLYKQQNTLEQQTKLISDQESRVQQKLNQLKEKANQEIEIQKRKLEDKLKSQAKDVLKGFM